MHAKIPLQLALCDLALPLGLLFSLCALPLHDAVPPRPTPGKAFNICLSFHYPSRPSASLTTSRTAAAFMLLALQIVTKPREHSVFLAVARSLMSSASQHSVQLIE